MAGPHLPQSWSTTQNGAEYGVRDLPVERESTLKSALLLVALLRRHWLLILAITVASVGVLVYRVRNEPRIYRATATVRLHDKAGDLSNGVGQAPPRPGYYMYNDPVLTQIEVLQSQAVAESVAEREGLRLRALPTMLPPSWANGIHVAGSTALDTIHVAFSDTGVLVNSRGTTAAAPYGQEISFSGVQFVVPSKPPIRAADLTLISLESAANEVRGSLSGHERERTEIIDVYYTAQDPALAQRVANAAVHVFQEYSAQTAKQVSTLRRQFIESQLAKTETFLADARNAHNAFRSQQQVYSSQDKFKAQQADLTTIDFKREELIADRATNAEILDELTRAQKGQSSTERLSALAASPGITGNTVVAQLFAQLMSLQLSRDSLTTGRWAKSATNPQVRGLDEMIVATENKIVNAVRANLSVVDARISSLAQQKASVAAGISKLPQAEATEATLLAQVNTFSRQVDRLRDELQSAEIAEAAEAGQVEIVDLARADGIPIGTSRKPKMVLAILLGLTLGVIVAYVLENYRPVIRRRDELEAAISLPNLALVPQIRRLEATGGRLLTAARMLPGQRNRSDFASATSGAVADAELVTLNDTHSSGAEAYRTLRTNLLFSAAVRAVTRIVITSPGPEEGKSTTAANLAIAYAQQGHKVLLIDCDLRRSRIHKLFQQLNTPGLTSVLVAGKPPADAIRPTKIDGLMILPSGPQPPNPAELLGSHQMKALLDRLSESYDLLILDTPPLLAASDAAILGRMVDGALVVVRAGRTERSALQTAIQQLATVGARVLGTVLNDPDAEVPKYTRYYRYYYNNYYEYSNGNGAPPQAVPGADK